MASPAQPNTYNVMKDVEMGLQDGKRKETYRRKKHEEGKIDDPKPSENTNKYDKKHGSYLFGTCYEPIDILRELNIKEP